jgi:glycosyltransferase involved in cell wall biosynthesis
MTALRYAQSHSRHFGFERPSIRPRTRAAHPDTPPGAGRIAILFQDFAAGGTERIMIRLANEWAKSREVFILCGSEQGPARDRVDERVTVLPIAPEIPRSALSRFRIGRSVAGMLPSLRPDVLVGPGNHVLPIFGALGKTGVPLVCKLSNPADLSRHGMIPRGLLRWASARTCRPLDAVVAMSPALAEEAEGFLGTGNLRVIPEPILIDASAKQPEGRPNGPPRLLVAGRLVRQKNVALALRTLAAGDPSSLLTIAGDGPERAQLQRLAAHLGIASRVTFLGHVADIGPLLARSDLLLMTSLYEGYPAVLVEALAAGVPVVTTDSSPAIPEILGHPSFGRVAPADPIALARAIDHAMTRRPDAAAQTALIARHGAEANAALWLHLFDAIVRSRVCCGSALDTASRPHEAGSHQGLGVSVAAW